MNNYVDIKILSSDHKTKFNLIGRTMTIIHAFNQNLKKAGENSVMAIDFPELMESDTAPNFGSIMRIFGSREALVALHVNPFMAKCTDDCVVALSPPKVTPDSDNFVQLRQCRRAERAIAKGLKPEQNTLPYVIIQRKSQGRATPTFIKRTTTQSKGDELFNTYGLCLANSTIPSF
ncbi:hypothetical protein VCHA53O466_40030 [Vibrio chagasii]|nr:hypothetical protein VCHA53O466_40030 [Vibrio chagasii]